MQRTIMQAVLIVSILTGFLSSGIARYLDFLMTKGHVLDFVRERAARRAAKKVGLLELFDGVDGENWEHRADIYDQIYWHIAKERKRFTIWICVFCMSVWLLYLIFPLLAWYTGLSPVEIVISFLFSITFNYQFLIWLA